MENELPHDRLMIIMQKLAVMFKDMLESPKRKQATGDLARQKVRLLQQLQPAGDFQQSLQLSRERAELTGEEFSLLVFELSEGASNELMQKLWQMIYRRVRFSDEMGWLSQQSLGVILSNTPFAGAHKLAEDICRLCEASLQFFSFKIYTYPSQQQQSQPVNSNNPSYFFHHQRRSS